MSADKWVCLQCTYGGRRAIRTRTARKSWGRNTVCAVFPATPFKREKLTSTYRKVVGRVVRWANTHDTLRRVHRDARAGPVRREALEGTAGGVVGEKELKCKFYLESPGTFRHKSKNENLVNYSVLTRKSKADHAP